MTSLASYLKWPLSNLVSSALCFSRKFLLKCKYVDRIRGQHINLLQIIQTSVKIALYLSNKFLSTRLKKDIKIKTTTTATIIITP